MRILGDTSHMAIACCAHRLQPRKLMNGEPRRAGLRLAYEWTVWAHMGRDEHFGYLRGFLTRTAAKSVQLYTS